MASRRKKTAKSCSLYPDLHDGVETFLKEDDLSLAFHPVDDNETAIEWYSTCVMGQFLCQKASCSSNGWFSKKIAIRIRMYAGGRYNARIYHQRCQQCNSLSRPKLDAESYAERVSYRLKKWSDVDVKPPPYGGKKGKPHRSELCEGCKVGDCEEGRLEAMMAGLDLS